MQNSSSEKSVVIPMNGSEETRDSEISETSTIDPVLDSSAVDSHSKNPSYVVVLHGAAKNPEEIKVKENRIDEYKTIHADVNSIQVSSKDSTINKDSIEIKGKEQLDDNIINNADGHESDESDETIKSLQKIRVKFLRIARRLGRAPNNAVVARVVYSLRLAELNYMRKKSRVAAVSSFDRTSAIGEQLEKGGEEPLDFTCTILVIGKIGVGKSATINSIFGGKIFSTAAFQSGTEKVQDFDGSLYGIRVRVIDTPGLLKSGKDHGQNVKILRTIKSVIRKSPPDIILYLDRLDMKTDDIDDMRLLRSITEVLGKDIWFKVIVVLTHAASDPPEEPNGVESNYDTFVMRRSLAVQQAIRQTAGDIHLLSPVSLVENHSDCLTNRVGQRVFPTGQVWKTDLLLLSFASKIIYEADTLLSLHDSPGNLKTPERNTLYLPRVLSSFLQPRERFMSLQDQLYEESKDFPKGGVRPIVNMNGWEHNNNYEGIDLESQLQLNDNVPASIHAQLRKDKKFSNFEMELASSFKHDKEKSTTIGFDTQSHTHSRHITYSLRSETLFGTLHQNHSMVGVSVTKRGDAWAAGMKVENKRTACRWVQLLASAGSLFTPGDTAHAGNLVVMFTDSKDPLGRFLTAIGASVMNSNGELQATEYNARTEVPMGRSMNLIGQLHVNSIANGRFCITVNSAELQIALLALVPLLSKLRAYFQQ